MSTTSNFTTSAMVVDEKGVIQSALDPNHPAACHPTIIDAENCLIDWKGRTKLAIIGFASSSRDRAPYGDPEWVIWGLNQLNRHIPRADAWIDIHHDYNAKAKVVEGTDFDGFLRSCGIPVFLCRTQPEIPTSVRYPVEEIIAKYGIDYFTSTISFMIAYGIWAGFRTIGIWGVDLIVGKEYFHQKACAEFWLGMANASGVEVKLPGETALLKQHYRYGYQDEPEQIIKFSEIAERLAQAEKRREELIKELQTVDGYRQAMGTIHELYDLRLKGGTIPLQ